MLSDNAEKIKKTVNETPTDEIGDLLKKCDKSEKNFIQKYAETEIAVRSLNLTTTAIIFAIFIFLITACINIAYLVTNSSIDFNLLSKFVVIFFVVVIISAICTLIILYFYNTTKIKSMLKFVSRNSKLEIKPLQHIILKVEDDKLTMQNQIDSLTLINPIATENIKNLVKVKKEDGYRFKCYGENLIAVIIGETHNETPDQLELQKIIIKTLNPEYIISERSASEIKSQILQKDRNITEKACFVGLISSSEETQADIITSCSEVCTRPIVAIIGHYHASKMSEIHEFLELRKIDYICIWNEEEAKKVRQKHEKMD